MLFHDAFSENCGASSPTTSHEGLLETQMCPRTPTPGSSSRRPAGTNHLVFSESILGSGEPQLPQNAFPQRTSSNSLMFSRPEIHTTFSGRAQSTAFEPVPDTFRHFEQWHFPTGPIRPFTSNTHAPQRQLPFTSESPLASNATPQPREALRASAAGVC